MVNMRCALVIWCFSALVLRSAYALRVLRFAQMIHGYIVVNMRFAQVL